MSPDPRPVAERLRELKETVRQYYQYPDQREYRTMELVSAALAYVAALLGAPAETADVTRAEWDTALERLTAALAVEKPAERIGRWLAEDAGSTDDSEPCGQAAAPAVEGLVEQWNSIRAWPDPEFDTLGLDCQYDMEYEAARRAMEWCAAQLAAALAGPSARTGA